MQAFLTQTRLVPAQLTRLAHRVGQHHQLFALTTSHSCRNGQPLERLKFGAAMQASLIQTRPVPAQLTRLAQQAGQHQQQLALAGPGAATPGLQNQIGEYNCFLNVVVQCLWHCREFKYRFGSLALENPAIVEVNSFNWTLPAQTSPPKIRATLVPDCKMLIAMTTMRVLPQIV